jgi:hypothetical protein
MNETFEELYNAWRSEPFPEGSDDDEVDELHADLALADTNVAAVIVPFVEHGRSQAPAIDVMGSLEALRSRASALREAFDDERKVAISAYDKYAETLESVYRAFLASRSPG